MTDNRLLTFVYTFFLGLMLAFFVGFGINTFYPGPTAPSYSAELETYGKTPTDEQIAKQNAFNREMEQYNKELQPYSRNVSMISLVAAVALLMVSILSEKRVKVMANGIMLGGLFTLIYSIIRAAMSENSKYIFIVVSIGLAVVLYLGYHRFVRKPGPTKIAVKSA